MLIDEMHFELKLYIDKVDSQDRRNFEKHELDHYINRAILKFVVEYYDLNRSLQKGFETDQKRISQLANLHIKSPELQPGIIPVEILPGKYEIQLDSLGSNINGNYFRYLFATKIVVEAEKTNCGIKLLEVPLIQIDDLKTYYLEPNFNWGRVSANFGRSNQNSLYVSTPSGNNKPYMNEILDDSGILLNSKLQSLFLDSTNKNGVKQYNIKKCYISYIKYPNRVFSGGYNHIDGLITSSDPQVHCDIEESFHGNILRIAQDLILSDIRSKNDELMARNTALDKF